MKPTLIIALIGAILGPLVGFGAAVYKFRGTIKTSAADDLWTESRNMRLSLQGQLDAALARITAVETRAASAETRNIELYRQTIECQRIIDAQAREISKLNDEVRDLRSLVKTLQGEGT